MNVVVTVIIALLSALLSAVLTAVVLKSIYSGRLELAGKESEMQKQIYEQTIRTVKAEITSQTEQILKSRQKELDEQARKTFSDITSGLDKDLKEMKDSFEKTSKTSAQTTAELKENINIAVKHLAEQTADVGRKADNLAGAMRAEVKGQGIWGESLFENMLEAEGFVKGRDYNREDVLRDDLGFTVKDEEGRGLRPDFVLHYPDDTDVIVDSKVSVRALADYMAAGSDEEKSEAAKRNYDAVWEQVCRLARKDYIRYKAKSGRKTLDYVLMFIPNYGAMQLAKQSDPDIWRKAFEKNVLIITEETAMPFLRMIRSAWASYDQVRSQKLIVEAAERMLDRVAEFSKAHAEMGRNLEKARECFDRCDLKLRDSGQSITVAAREVVRLGVPSKKPLPVAVGSDSEHVPGVTAPGELD
ncbi:MAG: DNA recombination protein RmuC [Bacteroidales bacterium]|nr:DNA recombination protein RmuC [Bacteroidales bacterium]